MATICIETSICIKCSKCVKVCPVYIFSQKHSKAEVTLSNMSSCILCGHCVDVCPTSAISHSEFPESKIHDIKREILPQPEQVLELLRARRSNRAASSSPVPNEFLNKIVEAAHLAPTASNMQEVSFTLVTSPDLLKKISDLTIECFEENYRKISNPIIKPFLGMIDPSLKDVASQIKTVIDIYKSGTNNILREAKAVLFIHTPQKSRFGVQDSNMAYQNGSLMAESLGVAQFYTGFVCVASRMDKKDRLVNLLKIKGEIHAGMALSMPSFLFTRYSDRKPLNLNEL